MTKKTVIERTIKILHQLPEEKAIEVSNFVEFISRRSEERQLTKGIQYLTSKSRAFDFLEQEEDLYSEADLKEVYP